jgi:hypothetical protein
MENMQWMAPLKSGVTLMFFLVFSVLLVSAAFTREDERLRRLPLDLEEQQ